MKLTHVTNTEIKEINRRGRWNSFLFFSEEENGAYEADFMYTLNVSEDEIINSDELDGYDDMSASAQGIVDGFAMIWGLCPYDAFDYIAEQSAPQEIACSDDYAEFYVDCQTAAAELAKAQGFRGVRVEDDTGIAVMVCMLGRENELQRVA